MNPGHGEDFFNTEKVFGFKMCGNKRAYVQLLNITTQNHEVPPPWVSGVASTASHWLLLRPVVVSCFLCPAPSLSHRCSSVNDQWVPALVSCHRWNHLSSAGLIGDPVKGVKAVRSGSHLCLISGGLVLLVDKDSLLWMSCNRSFTALTTRQVWRCNQFCNTYLSVCICIK